MNKAIRNFWLALALYLLLGLNIVLLLGGGPLRSATHLSLAGHIHALSGILLALGCLVHAGLHRQWFRAALAGKATGKGQLLMTGVVTILVLLTALSGHGAATSAAGRFAGRFHSLIGSVTLIGLSIHAVMHARWMAAMARRLLGGQRRPQAIRSAE